MKPNLPNARLVEPKPLPAVDKPVTLKDQLAAEIASTEGEWLDPKGSKWNELSKEEEAVFGMTVTVSPAWWRPFPATKGSN